MTAIPYDKVVTKPARTCTFNARHKVFPPALVWLSMHGIEVHRTSYYAFGLEDGKDLAAIEKEVSLEDLFDWLEKVRRAAQLGEVEKADRPVMKIARSNQWNQDKLLRAAAHFRSRPA